MTRGTTPTITINTAIDLSSYLVYFTICNKDKKNLITIENPTVTTNSVTIELTQEQTLSLESGDVFMQIRATSESNTVASNIMTAKLSDILQEGVI